ncbi:FkbM family methyltransferase [Halorientalis salina]|uniref:FkbM family methyltransferase n=1 Tax=Halorientalis salina TaxID=2932266 RepID=UPI0010AD3A9F|nr:FkbM family methyltransferase [Halorientalis salina]
MTLNMFKIPGKFLLSQMSHSKFTFHLQCFALNFVSNLPKHILADKGDTVLAAGVWRVETVEDWVDAVGPDGEVFVVEAEPQNVEILRVEKERRNWENVTILHRAVWNDSEEIEFLVSTNSAINRISSAETFVPDHPPEEYRERVPVQADTIDTIIEDASAGDVDLVFTQISGAEIEAVEGMEETLRQPDIRVWMRATQPLEDEDTAANEKIATMLQERGLTVCHGKHEPDRYGGNVYAARL